MGHALMTLAAIAAVAAAATGAEAQRVLKFSNIQPPDHPMSLAAEYFAERVRDLTGAELEVQVFHSRQLGDALQNVENIRTGSVAFTIASASNLSQVDRRMDMFSLPYIFKSEAHFWHLMNTERMRRFMTPLEDKGIRFLAFIDAGARSFFTKGSPVRTPGDLEGRKIRVMASPVMVASMQALGASGVPLAWGELYNALQTGVVDGAENNHPSILTMKFYEVTDYYSLDEHMRIPDTFLMSQRLFERLDETHREAILKAAEGTQAFMRGAWAAASRSALERLEAEFEGVVRPDKEPFIQAVSEVVRAEGERLGVTGTLDWILESGQAY